MNTPELFPCAHCGGQPRIVSPDIGDNTWIIYCRNCGSTLKGLIEEEVTVAAWNRRDESATLKEQLARQTELVTALHIYSNFLDQVCNYNAIDPDLLDYIMLAKRRVDAARARLAELEGKDG